MLCLARQANSAKRVCSLKMHYGAPMSRAAPTREFRLEATGWSLDSQRRRQVLGCQPASGAATLSSVQQPGSPGVAVWSRTNIRAVRAAVRGNRPITSRRPIRMQPAVAADRRRSWPRRWRSAGGRRHTRPSRSAVSCHGEGKRGDHRPPSTAVGVRAAWPPPMAQPVASAAATARPVLSTPRARAAQTDHRAQPAWTPPCSNARRPA